ncbi:TadE/TadG family type IV pilus assembly protein [Acetobacter estunensis]
MSRVRKIFRRFCKDNDGSIAVMAALSIVPVMIGIAVAVDLGSLVTTRSHLQSIADAASLQATKAANDYLVSNPGTSSVIGALAAAQTAAQASVTANAAESGISPAPVPSVTYKSLTSYSGSVTVSLSETSPSYFGGLISSGNNTVSVTSTATMAEGNSYIQVLFVVDISNSMGVGGTTVDITALENGSGQCAFACHDPSGYSAATNSCNPRSTSSTSQRHSHASTLPSCDTRTTAKAEGINLKIDYVNQAVQTFISELQSYAQDDRTHITVGIDTFGTNFTQVLAPTTDLNNAATVAAAIDLEDATPLANANDNPNQGSTNYSVYNYGYTKTSAALQQVLSGLSNVGDGSSASSMKTYIIFLSDGAEDIFGSTAWHRIVDVNYSTLCSQLKGGNVRVFSIWAPYYAIPGDSQYQALVEPFAGTGSGSMQGTMEGCATSSADYFEANDGPAIQQAFSTTFDSIISDSALHLTQ